jgi:hypothetical protein
MSEAAANVKSKGGAPLGNSNRVIHRARGRVVLGEAPPGFGSIYRGVRETLKDLKAEYVAKHGEMTPSQEEALNGAGIWLARSRSWHRHARRESGLTDHQRNESLDLAAQAHDRYLTALRAMGLAKFTANGTNGHAGGTGLWATLSNGQPDAEPPDATEREPEAAMARVNR